MSSILATPALRARIGGTLARIAVGSAFVTLFTGFEYSLSPNDAVVLAHDTEGGPTISSAVLTVTVTQTLGYQLDSFTFWLRPETGSGVLLFRPKHQPIEISLPFSPEPKDSADNGTAGDYDAAFLSGHVWVAGANDEYVRAWVYDVELRSEGDASVRIVVDALVREYGCSEGTGIALELSDIVTVQSDTGDTGG